MSIIAKENNTSNTEDFTIDVNGYVYDYTATNRYTLPSMIKDYNEELPIVEGTGEILEDSSRRNVINWHEYKKNSRRLYEAVTKWNRHIHGECIMSHKQLERLFFCGNDLTFAVDTAGNKQLKHAYFCKHKLCPMCNFRRSRKMFNQVSQLVHAINADNKDIRFLFLTLTIKNCKLDKLKETIKLLNKAYINMMTKEATKYNSKFRNSVLGSIKCMEVTFNTKTMEAHPHIHAIIAVNKDYFTNKNKYCEVPEIQEMWKHYLKVTYVPLINIQRIKTDSYNNAVAETAKYPIKLDLSKLISLSTSKPKEKEVAKLVYEYIRQTHKLRMVTFYGIFKEYKKQLSLDDIEDGDLMNAGENTIDAIEYQIYRYNARVGLYIC